MQKRTFAGLDVVVENPKGTVRQWRDRDARLTGETVMKCDYGFIDGHVGADGDEVDCYLGDDEAAPFVHVVHQLKTPDYEAFDEDKVFLGFKTEQEAKASYLSHRTDGEKAYGGMSVIPLEKFKAKLARRTGAGKIRHEVGQEGQVAMSEQISQPNVVMRVEQRGDKWVVLPESGDRVLGTHDTKADAEKQLAAIEASKTRATHDQTPGRFLKFEAGSWV